MNKRLNKKGQTQLVLLLSIAAALISVLSFSGIISTAAIFGSGDYIERPVFYYDKCEATSSFSYSASKDLATKGQWLDKPSVTNSYNVQLTSPPGGTFKTTIRQFEYYICNSRVLSEDNCRIYSKAISTGFSEVETISGVRNNENVWVQYQEKPLFSWKEGTGAKYQIGFTPYGIRQYNVLGGSANQISANSCTYPSLQRDTFLDSDSNKVDSAFSGIDRGTNERVLQPEEVRWYVAGYLTSAAPSFELTYQRKDAWCRPTGGSAEIYEINEIETVGGTYKVASADWSDKLGTVTCCPGQTQGEEVCSDDFKWETIQGEECSAFRSCGSPNFVPYDSGTLIKYSCVSGFCEPELREVECASNSDCTDANQVCDLNSFSCEKANVNLDGQVIITIPDSQAACDEAGGKWISKTSEEKSLLNVFGIGQPDVVVEEYCKMPGSFNFALWGIIAGIVLILFIFRGKILAVLRILLSKVGIK